MEQLEEAGELRTPVQDRVRAWQEAEREQGRAEGVEHERALLLRQTERKFGANAAGRATPFWPGSGSWSGWAKSATGSSTAPRATR
jgi:hypothetical protein